MSFSCLSVSDPEGTLAVSQSDLATVHKDEVARGESGLTGRSLALAAGLTLLAGLWVRQSEIVVLSTQITESIPAIPGLAALVLLLVLNVILRRTGRIRPFTRAEILIVFFFVTISSTVMGIGITQFLFALMSAPFYFTQSNIREAGPLLPDALMPHDLEVMRGLYEGSRDGRVPWHAWWGPCLLWLGFFLALWCTLYCLMALFYRVWAEEERLAFPQVFIPLEMTGGESGKTPFFRNRLMWIGFLVAAFYNGINITHALIPSFPAFGKEIDLSEWFRAPPWNEFAPLKFHIRPEMIGLGYLVSTEISLTVWISFLAMKLVAVAGTSLGIPAKTLPYAQEQGIGAYLALAAMLVWITRGHLLRTLRAALRGKNTVGTEGIPYRWAYLGLMGGFVAVWCFMSLAGMSAWVALTYLILIMAVALVYGRLRAEAGVPLVWLFPYYMQKQALIYTFGSQPFAASSPNTLPTWTLFTFLARGYYPEMTGYQVEGMELARRAHIPPRRMAFALLLAVGLGFLTGWYNHLTPYYHYGAQQLRGGMWGTWIATPDYQSAVRFTKTPVPPEMPRIWASLAGVGVVLVLWTLRLRFAGFLLHPLGYVMTCSYGGLIWSSFLIVWLLKSLTLRYGGMRLYRRTVPFFLGLALGHFAIAGIFWGLTGAWTGDSVHGYEVFFG